MLYLYTKNIYFLLFTKYDLVKVLGYRVVASSSTAVKQDYNEYMWTMRKEFSEPEPDDYHPHKIDVPE